MNDTKNILLAWVSSVTSIFTAIESGGLVPIISAVALPVILFLTGKAIDVIVQLYLHDRRSSIVRPEAK